MADPIQVACPRCGKRKNKTTVGIYLCDKCGATYDDDPEEGGTHSAFNPAARLEREERQKAQRRAKR